MSHHTDQMDQFDEGEFIYEGEDHQFLGEGELNFDQRVAEMSGEGEFADVDAEGEGVFDDLGFEGESFFDDDLFLTNNPFQFHMNSPSDVMGSSLQPSRKLTESNEDDPISLLSSDDESPPVSVPPQSTPSHLPTTAQQNCPPFDENDFQNTSSLSIPPLTANTSFQPTPGAMSIASQRKEQLIQTPSQVPPTPYNTPADPFKSGNKRTLSQLQQLSPTESDNESNHSQVDLSFDELDHSDSDLDLTMQSIRSKPSVSINMSHFNALSEHSTTNDAKPAPSGFLAKAAGKSSLLQSTSKLYTNQQNNKKQKLSRATIAGLGYLVDLDSEADDQSDGFADVSLNMSQFHDSDYQAEPHPSSRGSILSEFGQNVQREQQRLEQDVFNSVFSISKADQHSTRNTSQFSFPITTQPLNSNDDTISLLDTTDEEQQEQEQEQEEEEEEEQQASSPPAVNTTTFATIPHQMGSPFLQDFNTMSAATALNQSATTITTFNQSTANLNQTTTTIPHSAFSSTACVDLLSSDDGEPAMPTQRANATTQIRIDPNLQSLNPTPQTSYPSPTSNLLVQDGSNFDIDGFLADKYDRMTSFLEIPEPTTSHVLSLLQSPPSLLSSTSNPAHPNDLLNRQPDDIDMTTTLDTQLTEAQKLDFLTQFQWQTTQTLATTFSGCQNIWKAKEAHYVQQIHQLQEVIHMIKGDFMTVQQKYLDDVIKIREETNTKQHQMYLFSKEVIKQCQDGLLAPNSGDYHSTSSPDTLLNSLNNSVAHIEQMYNNMGQYQDEETLAANRLNETLLAIAEDIGIVEPISDILNGITNQYDPDQSDDEISDDISGNESDDDLVMNDSFHSTAIKSHKPRKHKKSRRSSKPRQPHALLSSTISQVSTSTATLEVFAKLQDKLLEETKHVTHLFSQNNQLEIQNSALLDEISTLHTVLSTYQAQEELNYRQKMQELGDQTSTLQHPPPNSDTEMGDESNRAHSGNAAPSFYSTQLHYSLPLLPLQTYPRTHQDIYQLVVILQTQKNELLEKCKNIDLVNVKQQALILQLQSKLHQFEAMNVTSQAVSNLLHHHPQDQLAPTNPMTQIKNFDSLEELDKQLAIYEAELNKSLDNIVALENEQTQGAQSVLKITPFDTSNVDPAFDSLFPTSHALLSHTSPQLDDAAQNSAPPRPRPSQLTAYERLHQKVWADFSTSNPTDQTTLTQPSLTSTTSTTPAHPSNLNTQRQLLAVYRELLELRRLYANQLQTHQFVTTSQNARLQKIPLMEEQIRTLNIGIDSKQEQIRALLRDNLGLKYYVNKLQQWINTVGRFVISSQFQGLFDEYHLQSNDNDLEDKTSQTTTPSSTSTISHTPQKQQSGSNFISDVVFSSTKAKQQLPMTNTPSKLVTKFVPTDNLQNDLEFILNSTTTPYNDHDGDLPDTVEDTVAAAQKLRQSMTTPIRSNTVQSKSSLPTLPHSTIKKAQHRQSITEPTTNQTHQPQQQMALFLHGKELTPFDISEQIKHLLTKYESVELRYKLLHTDFLALQAENASYLDKIVELEQKVASDEVLGHLDVTKLSSKGVKSGLGGTKVSGVTTSMLPPGFTSINEQELQNIIRERNQYKTDSMTLSIELNETKQFLTTCLNTTQPGPNLEMGDDYIDPLDEVSDDLNTATPLKSSRQSLAMSTTSSPVQFSKQTSQLVAELSACKEQLSVAEAGKVSCEVQIAQFKSTILGLVTTNQTQRDALSALEKAYESTKLHLDNAQTEIAQLQKTQKEIVLSHSQLLKNIAEEKGDVSFTGDSTADKKGIKTPTHRKSTRYSTIPTIHELNTLLTPSRTTMNTSSTRKLPSTRPSLAPDLEVNRLFNEFDSDSEKLDQTGNSEISEQMDETTQPSNTHPLNANSFDDGNEEEQEEEEEEVDVLIAELESQILQYQQQITMLEQELRQTKTNLLNQLAQQDVHFAELCSEIQRLERYERQYTEDQEKHGLLNSTPPKKSVTSMTDSNSGSITSESTAQTSETSVDSGKDDQSMKTPGRVHILRFKYSPIELAHKQWCTEVKEKNEQYLAELTTLRGDLMNLVNSLNTSLKLQPSISLTDSTPSSMSDHDAIVKSDATEPVLATLPLEIVTYVQKYIDLHALRQRQSQQPPTTSSILTVSTNSPLLTQNPDELDMFDLARLQKLQNDASSKASTDTDTKINSLPTSPPTSDQQPNSPPTNNRASLSVSNTAPIPLVLTPEQIIQLRAEVTAVRDVNSQLYAENTALKTTTASLNNDLQAAGEDKVKLLSTVQEVLHQKLLLERTVSNLTQDQRKSLATIREMMFFSSGWLINIEHRSVPVQPDQSTPPEATKPRSTPSKLTFTPSKSLNSAAHSPEAATKTEIWFHFSIRLGSNTERFSISINANILPLLKQTGIERSFQENAEIIASNVLLNNETVRMFVRKTELPGISSKVFGQIRHLIRDLLSTGKLTTFMTQLFFYFTKLKQKMKDEMQSQSQSQSQPPTLQSQSQPPTILEEASDRPKTDMNDDETAPSSAPLHRQSLARTNSHQTPLGIRRTTAAPVTSLTNHTPSKRK